MVKVLLGLNLIFWALLAVSGISGYIGIVNQQVPDFPNSSQALLYVIIPLGIVIATVLALVILKVSGHMWVRATLVSWLTLTLIGVLPYIIISRGGV